MQCINMNIFCCLKALPIPIENIKIVKLADQKPRDHKLPNLIFTNKQNRNPITIKNDQIQLLIIEISMIYFSLYSH